MGIERTTVHLNGLQGILLADRNDQTDLFFRKFCFQVGFGTNKTYVAQRFYTEVKLVRNCLAKKKEV